MCVQDNQWGLCDGVMEGETEPGAKVPSHSPSSEGLHLMSTSPPKLT